ncbi:hypothetical protein [Auritidibacter ignavus]|uniref:hypothetical protein n=1 Tax=Auritidibacter ignavus TaxID=678932 RepID=UPI000F026958|nr:hypothetical protein [Auritidibacter ignavus]NIH70482.1 hypothetical protein [Auritidibacter ignavus]RMX23327.1 hypothetical protein DYI20_05525 [Auritidibacter ignavus]
MRVIAVEARTGRVLDWELQAHADEVTVTEVLDGHTVLDLSLRADYHARKDRDGHPVLLEQGTVFFVEDDDGKLLPAVMDSGSLETDYRAEASGPSRLAHDMPWTREEMRRSGTDALHLWKHVWSRIIIDTGIYALDIDGLSSSGQVVGRAPTSAYRDKLDELKTIRDFLTRRKDDRTAYWEKETQRRARVLAKRGGRSGVGEIVTSTDPPEPKDGASYKIVIHQNQDGDVLRVWHWKWSTKTPGTGEWYYRSNGASRQAAKDYLSAKNTLENSKNWFGSRVARVEELEKWLETHEEEQGPDHYTISPWEDRDLSDTLQKLQDIGGFEYVETGSWVDDMPHPVMSVARRFGTRRHDLRYELGANVHDIPEVQRGEFFTRVTVTGSGEGKSTLMEDRAWKHPRLLDKHVTVSESDLGTRQLVRSRADKELKRLKAGFQYQLDRLTVVDSPLAPNRLLNIGDEIRVVGDMPDGTGLNVWVRVVEITRSWSATGTGDTMELGVEPIVK